MGVTCIDFFFFKDQEDHQEDDAVESIKTDSDDCIISSPVSTNIKQLSQSVHGNYMVRLRKIF